MLAVLLLAALSPAHAQEGMVQMGGTAATPDFYVIQSGDTLWDISQRFLADPYQWPQLWSYNEYVTNPHWIYPGNKIYFNLGDALTPPSAGVDLVQEVPYQPPKQQVAVTSEDCDFPARFDDVRRGQRLSSPGLLGIAQDFNARGRVIAASTSGLSVGESDYVYLKLDDTDGVECGTLLSLYRKNPDRVRTKDGVQFVYRVVGTVRVIRVDDNVATAEVRDGFSESLRGDIVGDAFAVDVTVDVDPPEGDVKARVLARLTTEQALASTYETLFLDVGTNDGVDVGTSLFLVTQADGMARRMSEPDTRLPERVTGRVVVVRAEANRSAAVVVDASEEYRELTRVVATPNQSN
jgi:hypothetical protein